MIDGLFFLLGGAIIALAFTLRKREGTDQRLANVLLGVGIVLMLVSIIQSGITIGRS